VHLLPVDAAPVVRFVGHPDLEANRPFLMPWIERVGTWIEEGKRPFIFMHMPNKGHALSLAELWNELLRKHVSTVDPLCLDATQPQMGLF
jgi:uncharacterized protein YecE (DUF72 family)